MPNNATFNAARDQAGDARGHKGPGASVLVHYAKQAEVLCVPCINNDAVRYDTIQDADEDEEDEEETKTRAKDEDAEERPGSNKKKGRESEEEERNRG